MCGITGIFDIQSKTPIGEDLLSQMAGTIAHRGPDETSFFVDQNVGFGFKRLSIIDLSNGHQPFFNDDASVRLICNGEIFNYKELRRELVGKGYAFKTNCDVEVILHLYAEHGIDFINRLNGQFAFALSDKKNDLLLLVRDQFGICPLFYTVVDDVVVFGSEVKSILKHPAVRREVDLTGLDQVLSLPGMVSPSTMFKNIRSLKPGHYVLVKGGHLATHAYWDLDYPEAGHAYGDKPESYYIDQLEDLLLQSVRYRLNAEVPVGFYLSGGLDSSLVGALMKKINPGASYKSFSIGFPGAANREIDERQFQRMMARHVQSTHHEIAFDWPEIDQGLRRAVYFSESPLKETYNTCSLALSKSVYDNGIKVVLSGEGADEFMGGYIGYRFDTQRGPAGGEPDLNDLMEEQLRRKMWGDPGFFYEKNHFEFRETLGALYSDGVNSRYKTFDCTARLGLDKSKIAGRHPFHQRSYLDLKLRLSDHLIADHCDRVAYANSVEGRYPFLDINLVEFLRTVPPHLKLKGLVEKYILKQVAKKYLPEAICTRQKFGFVAPGSPQLLQNNVEWINDLLSYAQIKRQGYFNPDTVERLKKTYRQPGFKLNLPFDSDLLIVVLTFNLFLEVFDMPDA